MYAITANSMQFINRPVGVQGTRYKQVFLPYVCISYGLEGTAVAFLWHAEIQWLPGEFRIPKYFYLQAILEKT